MLLLVKSIPEIERILEAIGKELAKVSGKPYRVFYGKSKKIPINISQSNLGFWWGSTQIGNEKKYLNPFGIGSPDVDSHVFGDFEFSFSDHKHSGKFPSQFADENNQDVILLHRGFFGGHKSEFTINNFEKHCNKPGNELSKVKICNLDYFVIAHLTSANFGKDIFRFTNIVKDFKEEYQKR